MQVPPVGLGFGMVSRLGATVVGHQGWKWVTVTRFGLPEQRYHDFANAYGFDVRAWDGYETYRRL